VIGAIAEAIDFHAVFALLPAVIDLNVVRACREGLAFP
jgi:hypothetical protein